MVFNEAFSIRVRELLKERKMSQYKLEQETGIYHGTMSTILNAKTKASNFRTIALIIRALNISMSEFFDSEIFNFENLEIDEWK